MNVNEVIKYPILSEKTYAQMQNGVYTFVVDRRTNKIEIKKVIEHIFNVHVARVNITNYDAKAKRVGKFTGLTSAVKRAIITLKSGEKINIFPDEVTADNPSDDASKKDAKNDANNAAITDIERRAQAKISAKSGANVTINPNTSAPQNLRPNMSKGKGKGNKE